MDKGIEVGLLDGPIYNDGTYYYFGEADPGTALDKNNWRVCRLNQSTKQIEWANGNNKFENVYTDLPTVAAFDYS